MMMAGNAPQNLGTHHIAVDIALLRKLVGAGCCHWLLAAQLLLLLLDNGCMLLLHKLLHCKCGCGHSTATAAYANSGLGHRLCSVTGVAAGLIGNSLGFLDNGHRWFLLNGIGGLTTTWQCNPGGQCQLFLLAANAGAAVVALIFAWLQKLLWLLVGLLLFLLWFLLLRFLGKTVWR